MRIKDEEPKWVSFIKNKKKIIWFPSKVAISNQKHYTLTFNALWIKGSSTMQCIFYL